MPRLLLTNDDGADSPGIHAIARALEAAGHEVVVAAPADERSGWSAGVGYLVDGVEFDVDRAEVPGAPRIDAWAIEGPPAFCVLAGMLEMFGPRPDFVVSGSNLGTNCGRGVLHSGTVGGAMIAQNFGLSAIAVSQQDGSPMLWETSEAVTVAAVDWLAAAPRKTVLNINIPNAAVSDLSGVRWARLAAFGSTNTGLVGIPPGRMRIQVTPREVELKADTDTHLVDDGFVTVTGLVGFRAESDVSPDAVESMAKSLSG
ncbi:MAG: 5'/3'-nucleotidase SurE [Acidimicrobiales bacterium]